MMNLGGFAGGLAQGFQGQQRMNAQQEETQQRLQMQKDEMAQNNMFRERQIKMQEQDQAAKEETRDRERKLREESAALFKQYYPGDTEVTEERTVDDGAGNLAKIPVVKKSTLQPGLDKKRDADFYRDYLSLQSKYTTLSPEAIDAMRKRVEELRSAGVADLLDKVSMGDESAMGELLTKSGKNPAGARLEWNPLKGVNRIVLADGSEMDLRRYALANSAIAHQRMVEETNAARGSETHTANLGKTEALTNQAKAGTAKTNAEAAEIADNADARRGLIKAQTNAANAQAGAASEARHSAAQERQLRTVSAILDKAFPTGKSPTGEPITHPAKEFVTQSVLAAAPGKERQAAEAAMKRVNTVRSQMDVWATGVSQMPPKDRKAKYGTADVEEIKRQAISRALSLPTN